jgi:hypothetical protein
MPDLPPHVGGPLHTPPERALIRALDDLILWRLGDPAPLRGLLPLVSRLIHGAILCPTIEKGPRR